MDNSLYIFQLLRSLVVPGGILWLLLVIIGIHLLWNKKKYYGSLCLIVVLLFTLLTMDSFLRIFRMLRPLVSPCGMLWFFLVVMGMHLLWSKKKYCGSLCLTAALLFSLFGGRPFPEYLMSTLEKPYQNIRLEELPKCDAIILLGGGQYSSKYPPFYVEFNEAGDRVLHAFEAMRQGKAENIVLSSGFNRIGVDQKNPWGDYLTNWISNWDIFKGNISSLGGRMNTYDEAQGIKELAQEKGWKKIMLVTSAYHMKRSAEIFRRMDLEVVEYPVDFYVVGVDIPKNQPYYTLIPESQGLKYSEIWFKEIIGNLLYKLY